jgi:hypothetical protein
MCWNESVSLNTFVFSIFVLLLIIYNNAFTQYKIPELNNIWVYLFFTSVFFMQLIECFIWRNINNKFYNHIFSIAAVLLLILQPILSIMILTSAQLQLRNILLMTYLSLAIPYSIYKFSTKNVSSIVSENGHLQWKFFDVSPFVFIIWLFFLLVSFIYKRKWYYIIFGLVTLLISYYNYIKDNTMSSMWCWMVNVVMIYYAFYLLIVLPFFEKSSIC